MAFWLLRDKAETQCLYSSTEGLLFMSKKVLVVEDNHDCCELLVILLCGEGYDATGVHSGAEAIVHIRINRPDVIFMDLGLPNLDGIATATAIKQNPDTGDIPIIALSARLEDTWRRRALNAGMTLYLTKPAAPQVIIRAVHELTEKNRQQNHPST
jgi:CheY-like chemotaxis protein